MFTITTAIDNPDGSLSVRTCPATFAEVYPVILRNSSYTAEAAMRLTWLMGGNWIFHAEDVAIRYQAME